MTRKKQFRPLKEQPIGIILTTIFLPGVFVEEIKIWKEKFD